MHAFSQLTQMDFVGNSAQYFSLLGKLGKAEFRLPTVYLFEIGLAAVILSRGISEGLVLYRSDGKDAEPAKARLPPAHQ